MHALTVGCRLWARATSLTPNRSRAINFAFHLTSSCAVRSVNSTALLRPHKVSPRLVVPPHIPRPPYVDTGENPWFDDIQVHDGEVRPLETHCGIVELQRGRCISVVWFCRVYRR